MVSAESCGRKLSAVSSQLSGKPNHATCMWKVSRTDFAES
jgi:hypothetical protein